MIAGSNSETTLPSSRSFISCRSFFSMTQEKTKKKPAQKRTVQKVKYEPVKPKSETVVIITKPGKKFWDSEFLLVEAKSTSVSESGKKSKLKKQVRQMERLNKERKQDGYPVPFRNPATVQSFLTSSVVESETRASTSNFFSEASMSSCLSPIPCKEIKVRTNQT